MMKKTIFAALALAAAGPTLAQSEQTIQNGDFTETVEYSNDKIGRASCRERVSSPV